MAKGKGYEQWEIDGFANTIFEASLITVRMKNDIKLKKAVNKKLKMRQEASKDLVVK